MGDFDLPFAVIAGHGRFQHGRAANVRQSILQVGQGVYGRKRGRRQPIFRKKTFLAQPVLGDVQGLRAGAKGGELLAGYGRVCRYILKLIRHHIHRPRKSPHRVQIVIGGTNFQVSHLPGRRVSFRGKDMDAITQLSSRQRQHPPQLPTT